MLFSILKYLWTGYEGDSKFTISRDVNYDPTRSLKLLCIRNMQSLIDVSLEILILLRQSTNLFDNPS